MLTIVVVIASLVTDITLGGLAYKIAKSQDRAVKSLEHIAGSLDKRVSLLEERNVLLHTGSGPVTVSLPGVEVSLPPG